MLLQNGEYENALYRITPRGQLTKVLQTPFRSPFIDVHTHRIFAYDGDVLLEFDGEGFSVSALWDPDIQKPIDYHWPLYTPEYVPSLNAWIAVSATAFWMRFDRDREWLRIADVHTWRNDIPSYDTEVLHDKDRALVVVRVDVSVLVFDVSGPNPEFLYERVMRHARVNQADDGGVLVKLFNARKDVGWFEDASAVRVLTQNGAEVVSGAKITDSSREGGRGPHWMFNSQHNLGDVVLVIHEGGAALFDGRKMTNRPDLAKMFRGQPPFALRMGSICSTRTGSSVGLPSELWKGITRQMGEQPTGS